MSPELTWLLSTVTPMGLLERAHSYKDKTAKGLSASHGLFAYTVLMAADILIYDSNVVPVGQDQKQHVEMTRDIAIKFNEQYGETFVIPEPQIRAATAKVPGIDGEKMSKSYGNTIDIFGDEKALRKAVMSIKMDSRLADMLAEIIAHEVGHVFLGPNSHYPSGIMAAKWKPRDLIAISQGGYGFTRQQH